MCENLTFFSYNLENMPNINSKQSGLSIKKEKCFHSLARFENRFNLEQFFFLQHS